MVVSRKKKLSAQLGQTSLEYILVTSVIIAIGVAFLKKGKEFLVDSDLSFVKQLRSQLQTQFNTQHSPTLRYKKFKLNK